MERYENEQLLNQLSYIDKLTSFYNRNRYIQFINELRDSSYSIGIIFLDVNGLKETNDNFGHDSGDKLLTTCARIIRENTNSDNLYRIGGDEFVVIYLKISKENFYDQVRNLKNSFKESDCKIAVGFEWGNTCKDIEKIIKQADELMYENKKKFYQSHHKTNRYRHNNDELGFLGKLDIFKDKTAKNNFKIYLQAKVNIFNNKILGAEALARYEDEEGHIYTPDKFIFILEDAQFINILDYYIFENVCKQLWQWQNEGKTIYPISSNFSQETFMDDDFLQRLELIVDCYGIHKKYLQIELTESICASNYRVIKERINEIRKAGFSVSIDDFGIESSNLALLAITKFDILKIGKTFIEDIEINENVETIIETMVNLCNKMGIELVAKGVEFKSQLDILKKCGIKSAQGFMFSKPISISDFEEKYLK